MAAPRVFAATTLLGGFALAACQPETTDRLVAGRACSEDAKISHLMVGEPATFVGTAEVTPHGWIGMRFDTPVCIQLAAPNGGELGPKAFEMLPVAVPVDGRVKPVIPVGVQMSVSAELDFSESPGPILLRVLNVTQLEPAISEGGP